MRGDLKVCRLCAGHCKNTITTSLFDRSKKTALRTIFQLTNIKLKNVSNLPSVMCLECEKQLERTYEFRNRCISAQTYFSSSEYKCLFDQNHSGKHHDNPPEKESTSLNVEFLPYAKKNETTDLEFKNNSDINYSKDLQIEVESERNFEALNEGEVMRSMYDDGETELEMEYITHKLLPWHKTRKLKIDLKNDRDEGKIVDESISQPVKPDNNEQNSPDDENLNANAKEEEKNKSRTYICDQCGNNFKYRSHFYSHIKRHTGVKPLQCEVCPNKFFTEGELKRHMRRHTGERPFPCQHCERRFTDYSTRIKHERTHTNERPFGCPQCGKAFTTSYVLKNHMLVHTGERSFKCTLCNKSFQRQTHLIVHTRSLIHKQNIERQQQKLI